MNNTNHLDRANNIVDRLILQYKEYMHLMKEIDQLKTLKLTHIAQLSKKHALSIAAIKERENEFEELVSDNEWIRLFEQDLNRVSDEMTFANPLIWMVYKDRAYDGTSQEIKDWAAFKAHCAPEGYICGKRFRFLEAYMREKKAIEFKNLFSDATPLKDVYQNSLISDLLSDREFMEQWKKEEYLIIENRIGKWHILPK